MEANRPIKVLIADDEQAVVENATSKLRRERDHAFEVEALTAVEKVAEQIESKVEEFGPDVVLLDNMFGDQPEGVKNVLPRLKGRWPSLPVIIFTSEWEGDPQTVADAIGWNADWFLIKQTMYDRLTANGPTKLVDAITRVLTNSGNRGSA